VGSVFVLCTSKVPVKPVKQVNWVPGRKRSHAASCFVCFHLPLTSGVSNCTFVLVS
jgi:hypothetical protein